MKLICLISYLCRRVTKSFIFICEFNFIDSTSFEPKGLNFHLTRQQQLWRRQHAVVVEPRRLEPLQRGHVLLPRAAEAARHPARRRRRRRGREHALDEAERLEESFCTDVGVERKACPGCGDALLWTDHSDGRYIGGWACDNHLVCREWRSFSDLAAEDWWRFCCRRCHSDFCIACAGQLVRCLGSEGENAASLFDAGSAHGSTQAGGFPQA